MRYLDREADLPTSVDPGDAPTEADGEHPLAPPGPTLAAVVREVVAVVLTVAGVGSATAGGFLHSPAAGLVALGVGLLALGVLLGLG